MSRYGLQRCSGKREIESNTDSGNNSKKMKEIESDTESSMKKMKGQNHRPIWQRFFNNFKKEIEEIRETESSGKREIESNTDSGNNSKKMKEIESDTESSMKKMKGQNHRLIWQRCVDTLKKNIIDARSNKIEEDGDSDNYPKGENHINNNNSYKKIKKIRERVRLRLKKIEEDYKKMKKDEIHERVRLRLKKIEKDEIREQVRLRLIEEDYKKIEKDEIREQVRLRLTEEDYKKIEKDEIREQVRLRSIEMKKLFFCFRVRTCHDIVWYQIDPPNNMMEGSANAVCRVRVPAAEITANFATAALGSKIYMLGGDHYYKSEGSSDVLFFDTSTSSTGDGDFVCQKEDCHMLVKRSRPTAVATHGKLYVFGSNQGGEDRIKPWGEVFDPNSNCWSPLPEPPSQIRQVGFSLFRSAVFGDKILLCYRDSSFSFDVKTNQWEILTTTHPLLSRAICGTGLAFDDNILFTYCEGSVAAYDFSRKKVLKLKGLGIKSFSYMPAEDLLTGYIVRLDENSFCLVWYDEDNQGQVHVRCVRFRVARVNNSNGEISFFRAEVEGRSTYHIPYSGNFFMACFQL